MGSNFFTRQAGQYRNQLVQSCSELLGVAEGLIIDRNLSDDEIKFLDRWLETHSVVSCDWPGDVLHARVKAVLADGIIADVERDHLLETLRQIIGGRLDAIAESPRVNELALDKVSSITFEGASFCMTAEFLFGPRTICEAATVKRGGVISKGVNKRLTYLVVGGLGSDEWKHGSWGTKIDKAMKHKRNGVPLQIIHEDVWAASM
jgi:NAD-dependent DNA ligase